MDFLKVKSRLLFALAFITFSGVANASDVSWDGFGSVYYGQAFNKGLVPFGFTNGTHADFTDFSLIGLNVHGHINDKLTFFGQLVAIGGIAQTADYNSAGNIVAGNFQPFIQFAYLNYKMGELSIRAGRQGFPILMSGDSLRQTYGTPFRTKPTFIYNIPALSAYDGISFNYDWDLGFGKLGAAVFGGSPVNDFPYFTGETYHPSDLVGGKVTLDGDGWRARVQASQYGSRLQYAAPSGTTYDFSGTVRNLSLGYKFDKFNFVSWGEIAWFRTANGTNVTADSNLSALGMVNGQYYSAYRGGYVLVGYRVGDFLPRYTYAQTDSSDATYPGRISSHTFGVNWEVMKNATIKVEYELDEVPHNTPPFIASAYNGAPAANQGSAVYAGVDFVF